jgi:hypothetical protein
VSAIDRPRRSGAATAEDWAAFLRPLLAALNQQPSREQYLARCAAIAYALPDVPASLLVEWRQRDAMRAFRFIPNPAEVAEWIGPALRDERERAEMQRRLAAPVAPPAPTAQQQRTAAEIAAVQAATRALAAELTRDEPIAAARPAVRALPLSEAALLAHYEAAAETSSAAATRARILRQRMEAAAHG